MTREQILQQQSRGKRMHTYVEASNLQTLYLIRYLHRNILLRYSLAADFVRVYTCQGFHTAFDDVTGPKKVRRSH